MKISHSYDGLGLDYLKARKGTPKFAEFILSKAFLEGNQTKSRFMLAELGVGSGQQTEFVEKELITKGLTQYKNLRL